MNGSVEFLDRILDTQAHVLLGNTAQLLGMLSGAGPHMIADQL